MLTKANAFQLSKDKRTAAIVLTLTLIAAAPVYLRGTFPTSLSVSIFTSRILLGIALIIPFLAAVLCYRLPFHETKRQKLLLILLFLLLSGLMTDLHYTSVDLGQYFPYFPVNSQWQQLLHNNVLDLSPGALPLPLHVHRVMKVVLLQTLLDRPTLLDLFQNLKLLFRGKYPSNLLLHAAPSSENDSLYIPFLSRY